MTKENSQNVELTIEYSDDGDDIRSNVVDATVTTSEDEWTIEGDGFADPQTFRIVEKWDQIIVAPVDEYGLSPTQSADYEPGTGRVEPRYVKHGGEHVEAIVSDAIDETLGELVSEAREEFMSDRGIKSANEFDIPDIELQVRSGQPLFPSSGTGQTMAPRDRLIVEQKSDDGTFGLWHDAIVETANRFEVWAGTSIKDTDELLAPNGYEAGDTLTLPEYLDAFYTVNPQSVIEAVGEIEKANEQEARRARMESEHPELRHVTINNLDAFYEAENTGENVEVGEQTANCNDTGKECNLDLLTYYATPEGNVEVVRVHTH